ncbi:MAG: linear amide C-N hydrolase [Candidatus Aminicenantes bacterium]|nr:MAG: linear amide C-N hydrolase [Candidatus Aminicenantes bacterium]
MRNFKLLIKKLNPVIFFLLVVFLFKCDYKTGSPQQDMDPRQQAIDRLLATYDQEFKQYLANARETMGKEIMTYSPISTQNTIPQYVEIKGSYYEYGYLVALISQQSDHQPRRVTAGQVELNNRIIEMYRQVYPQFLEIARGVGDVFNIPVAELDFVFFEHNFFYRLWWDLFKYSEFKSLMGPGTGAAASTFDHCSIVSVKLPDRSIVGRNFDNDFEKPHFVVFTQIEGGYKVMANACYTMFHWVMDGINEKGLFMGTAANGNPPKYFWLDPYPDVPAIQQNHLFRIALETCATVDEVIALYRSVRPWSPHTTGHVLAADSYGNSVVIEFNLDRIPDFFRAEKNYQVLTNTAYHEGMDYMMENCWRFRTATNAAEAGIDDLNEMENIMKTIRGTDYGHISLFDFQNDLMRLFCRREFDTPYDFSLSLLQ